MTYSVLCAVRLRGTGQPGTDPYRPDLGLTDWQDVTERETPFTPPVYVVRTQVPDLAAVAVLDALAGVLVLYRRNDDNDADGDNDGDKLLGALQVTAARARLVALGVPSGAAATIVGSAGQFTRDQVAQRLVLAARAATKV